MVYDCLTKENFWDRLQQDAPDAVDLFLNWIDQYKKKIEWRCFQPGTKFHELPFDFQVGIIARFNREVFKLGWDPDMNLPDYMKEEIWGLFTFKQCLILAGEDNAQVME